MNSTRDRRPGCSTEAGDRSDGSARGLSPSSLDHQTDSPGSRDLQRGASRISDPCHDRLCVTPPQSVVPATPGSHIPFVSTAMESLDPKRLRKIAESSLITSQEAERVISALKAISEPRRLSLTELQEDASKPLAVSSPKSPHAPSTSRSRDERPLILHNKSQDRARDGRKSEDSRSSKLGPTLEDSGRMSRDVPSSGRDRDRERDSRRNRSPDRSRSHKSRHDHPDARTVSGSGADSAGSRSQDRYNSPSRSRDHSSRRRSGSADRRDGRSRDSERDRHRESRRSSGSSRSSNPRPVTPPRPAAVPDSKATVHQDEAPADPEEDQEPAGQTLVCGDYKFDDVLALLRHHCSLETLYLEEATPSGGTVLESLLKGRPASVPSRELPWQKQATSVRASLEKQLEEEATTSTPLPARSSSDQFTNPIIGKLKWYPIRGESSRATQVNGKVLDLVDSGRHDQVLKPQFSFSHSEVERLEVVFGGMSRITNFLDVSLLALSNCLRGANLPQATEAEALKIVLAASRASEALCQQAETSRANILLRRRDAVLSKINSLPQEDRLRLRCSPLSGPCLFPDNLLSTAGDHTRSVVRDEAIRRAVQGSSRGYQPRYPRPAPPPQQTYGSNSKNKNKKKKNFKPKKNQGASSSSSNPPPNQQQQQQQNSQQSFRGKGKGGGYKGKR